MTREEAVLEIIDNSLDAQTKSIEGLAFSGRVEISADFAPGLACATGVCIRNNCPKKNPPLKDVLKLFVTPKAGSGASAIGENGVG